MQLREAIRRYPLFNLLKPAWLKACLDLAETVPVEMGETLFQATTRGRYAYLVETGRVRVLQVTASGREVSVGSFGPGELFGEYALVPPGPQCRHLPRQQPRPTRATATFTDRHRPAAAPGRAKVPEELAALHAMLGHVREQGCLGFMAATSFLPLRDLCTTMQFQASEAIQADGLSADRWFVVLSGEVSVHCLPEEPWERAHVLGPGDTFGERALLEARRLPAARARTATECLTLRRQDFYALLGDKTSEEEQTYQVRPPAKKSYPWVAQREAADCGVAALAMVLRYYRPSAATEMLGQHLRLDSRGASLLQLQRAATRVGFLARCPHWSRPVGGGDSTGHCPSHEWALRRRVLRLQDRDDSRRPRSRRCYCRQQRLPPELVGPLAAVDAGFRTAALTPVD